MREDAVSESAPSTFGQGIHGGNDWAGYSQGGASAESGDWGFEVEDWEAGIRVQVLEDAGSSDRGARGPRRRKPRRAVNRGLRSLAGAELADGGRLESGWASWVVSGDLLAAAHLLEQASQVEMAPYIPSRSWALGARQLFVASKYSYSACPTALSLPNLHLPHGLQRLQRIGQKLLEERARILLHVRTDACMRRLPRTGGHRASYGAHRIRVLLLARDVLPN